MGAGELLFFKKKTHTYSQRERNNKKLYKQQIVCLEDNFFLHLGQMNINTTSFLEYFQYFIAIQSAMMDRKYKLTPKEQDYLAHCCAHHAQGGNLHDFEELSRVLIDAGVVGTLQECSVYKNRLSIKRWIDTGRGRFRLPSHLSSVKGYDLHIRYNDGNGGGDDGEISPTARSGSRTIADGPRLLRNLEGGDTGAASISGIDGIGRLQRNEGI